MDRVNTQRFNTPRQRYVGAIIALSGALLISTITNVFLAVRYNRLVGQIETGLKAYYPNLIIKENK